MRQVQNPAGPADKLSLSELLAQYVDFQVRRFQAGAPAPDLEAEVLPYDAGPAQTIDPRLAWDEAVTALQPGEAASRFPASVPEWKNLVAMQEPALDLPFCAGNFPQMVRNLSLLLQSQATGQPVANQTRPYESPVLVSWAREQATKPFPAPLLAIGVLRLAQQFDEANALLRQVAPSVPAEWKAAWVNEEASLAWHAGRRAEAADVWLTRGDATHVPTLFNRGLAALFLGRPKDARAPLSEAVSRLPDDNSWHHLARLYLTLAEMRG